MPYLPCPSPVTWAPQSLPCFESQPSWLAHEGTDSFISKVPLETVSGATLNGCSRKERLRVPLRAVGAVWPCRAAQPGPASHDPQCQASPQESQGKGGGSFSRTPFLGKRSNSSGVKGVGF